MATAPHETTERRTMTAAPLERHTPATSQRRPGTAVAALIVGIISIPAALIPIAGLILGMIAVVLGSTARGDIRRNGLAGASQATTAVVLGAIGIVLALGFWIASAIIAS